MNSGPSGASILEVSKLCRRFGGIRAVDDLNFKVQRNTVHGLIGPNGAGKTTTFNLISGFYAPSSGRIVYEGRDVAGQRTSRLANAGLIRTFQGTTLFGEFRVLDNVRVGCHRSVKASFLSRVLGTDRAVEQEADRKAREVLEVFGLGHRAEDLTSNLSHGHQRALGMAVALAADPKVLLLDEPFTGMNAEETQQMMGHIRRLRETRDITIMLVEHDMQAVMGLCDTITVMNFGRVLTEGTPEQIRNDPRVIEAYLGKAHAA